MPRVAPSVGPAVPVDGRERERGFITIQYVYVIATSLVLLAMFANIIVAQYGRGVVRSALDEGVRAGARVTAGAELARTTCEATANEARDDLLGGPMGSGVVIACAVAGDRVTARADAEFAAWFPAVPSWRFSETAVALREELPPAVAP